MATHLQLIYFSVVSHFSVIQAVGTETVIVYYHSHHCASTAAYISVHSRRLPAFLLIVNVTVLVIKLDVANKT